MPLLDPEDVIPKDFDDPRFADEKTRYATLQPKEVPLPSTESRIFRIGPAPG